MKIITLLFIIFSLNCFGQKEYFITEPAEIIFVLEDVNLNLQCDSGTIHIFHIDENAILNIDKKSKKIYFHGMMNAINPGGVSKIHYYVIDDDAFVQIEWVKTNMKEYIDHVLKKSDFAPLDWNKLSLAMDSALNLTCQDNEGNGETLQHGGDLSYDIVEFDPLKAAFKYYIC